MIYPCEASLIRGIHLTCQAEHLLRLVSIIEQEIMAAKQTARLTDWGWSCKQHLGYLVLEWVMEDEEVFECTIARWQVHTSIEDLCVYSIPSQNELGAPILSSPNERRLEVKA
jgi:hypothetical protein